MKLDSKSNPRRFLRGHFHRWEDSIDREKFQKFLLEYREKHHLSWSNVAKRAGLSLNHLNGIMWGKGRKGVSQDLVRSVVDRLHNTPTVDAAYRINDSIQIDGHRGQQGLMAYDPDCYGDKKTCSVCGIEQSLVFFHKDKKGAKGVRNACKACRSVS